MYVSVILVAGGQGARFGKKADRPKQFLPLKKKPLLYWPLHTFQKTPAVGDVVIVAPLAHIPWVRSFVRRQRFGKVSAVVRGGGDACSVCVPGI